MTSRRKFLKVSALGASLFAFNKNQAGNLFIGNNAEVKKPVVLSTWRFGVQANEGAWKVLMDSGRALDAVEAGVRITEANPDERSVGLGGRPDRDGHVTLDACIMDDKMNIGSVAFLQHIVHPISVARAVMENTACHACG
jgi:N4-(beta-N-acetylglucosaminyl)-L-asparaginase